MRSDCAAHVAVDRRVSAEIVKSCDHVTDVLDAIEWLILFRDGSTDSCLDRNGDGEVAVSDLVRLLIDIRDGNCVSPAGN